MSEVQTLRAFVNQRLAAAAQEIFEQFERTITEYEEELCRSKQENERQRKLLDAVFKPEVGLHRADVQQLLVIKEEVPPERQEWSPSLDHEDPPEPPHIKEEQEELKTSQEEEQLQVLEEADITKFTSVPDDEEEPQSSQLHQTQTEEHRDAKYLKTEADGEEGGGPGPSGNLNPYRYLQHAAHNKFPHFSESDSSVVWEEAREPQSSLNLQQNNEVPVSDNECNAGKTSDVVRHMGVHTAEKPFCCPFCGKNFAYRGALTIHLRIHTGEKPFTCSVCETSFSYRQSLKTHMKTHTGDRPFSCTVCGKGFPEKTHLRHHMRIHTGEKPFVCSVCGKRFIRHGDLTRHLTVHTGEKPFSCSVCDKRFSRRHYFKIHKCVGESIKK